MSKKRYLDTKFWSDGYIEELDPIEKLLFLYLLTNERTNVAGIYELGPRIMSTETGIEKSMVERIIGRFERDGKVRTYDKWIRLTNSDKHQNLENKNIQKGRENVLGLIPVDILEGLGMTVEDSSMTHGTVSNNLDLDLDSNLDSDSNSISVPAEAENAKSKVKRKTKEEDPVGSLYFKVVKDLALPIHNFTTVAARVKTMEKQVGREKSLQYLAFVEQFYQTLEDDGYKPVLHNALDLYGKRLNIETWMGRKVAQKDRPTATADGRPLF